jgi:hypothetical protein
MVDKTRKMVGREIGSVYLEGYTVVEAISMLQDKLKTYGDTLYIDKVYGTYGDSDYIAFFENVPETDDQLAARIRNEEASEENSRAWELKQYEALKAKYGDKLA